MKTIKAFVTSHAVPCYFALTFAISWGGALLAIGGSGGMSGTTPTSDPRFPFALLAMLAGPSTAGILLTGLVHGRAGLRAFRTRLLTWRVSVGWYAIALLTAPVLMTVTLLALSLFSPVYRPGIFATSGRTSLVLVGLAVGLGAGIFEELGWTGFAVPELRRRASVVATGLVVGVVWGAWHLLTNVLWASRASAGDLSLAIFLPVSILGVVIGYLPAFRVLTVWVYDRTGSLLVAILMHVSLTTSLLVLNPLAITGAPLLTYSFVLAAVVWLVVAAVVVASGGQLTRPSQWTPPTHSRNWSNV